MMLLEPHAVVVLHSLCYKQEKSVVLSYCYLLGQEGPLPCP